MGLPLKLFLTLLFTLPAFASDEKKAEDQTPTEISTPEEIPTELPGTFKSQVTLGALDKVTARLSHLNASINKPLQFGNLTITVRKCWQSDPEDLPETKVFLEIVDQKPNHKPETVFKGWMFASNHSISSLEHPVYDVWVLGSSGKSLDPHKDATQETAPSSESIQKLDSLLNNLFENTPESDVVD
jgi:hypothetical protein